MKIFKPLALAVLILTIIFSFIIIRHNNSHNDFKEISTAEFKTKFEKSCNNDTCEWIYMGSKKGFHFLIQKSPIELNLYKVYEKNLKINIESPLPFTINKHKWIYIDKKSLQFT